MGIDELKRMITYLRFSIAVLLLVVLVMSTKLERGECITSSPYPYGRCNGTVGECGQVDEFLMESEVSTRLLGGKTPPPQKNAFKVVKIQGQQLCKEDIYGNCLKPVNILNDARCTVHNRCDRNSIPNNNL